MLPDRVSNPGPLTYESGALPIALEVAYWRVLTVAESCSTVVVPLLYPGLSLAFRRRQPW